MVDVMADHWESSWVLIKAGLKVRHLEILMVGMLALMRVFCLVGMLAGVSDKKMACWWEPSMLERRSVCSSVLSLSGKTLLVVWMVWK